MRALGALHKATAQGLAELEALRGLAYHRNVLVGRPEMSMAGII